MLTSALETDARQRAIARRGLLAARAARTGTLDRLVALVVAAQSLAASEAVLAVPLILAEQGIDADMDARPVPRALTATASDGRSLSGLLDYARTEATASAFDLIVLTQLSDTARSGSVIASAVRQGATGYIRMLETPSCSRCAVLAGKFFRRNQGFQRHPKCDCRHIPSNEDTAGDLRTDPKAYFESLPTAADLSGKYPALTVKMRNELGIYSQEDVFTKAGARVIRDGADIGKVVNARAGMSTAQPALRGPGDRWTARGRLAKRDVFGRPLYTTSESMTKRGGAYKARGRKYVRLMPESIVELAGNDRGELLRLLKSHGYIA